MTLDYPHKQKSLDSITHISAVLALLLDYRRWSVIERRRYLPSGSEIEF